MTDGHEGQKAPGTDDDTWELELNAGQMLELSQQADAAPTPQQSTPPAQTSGLLPAEPPQPGRRPTRLRLWSLTLSVAALGTVAAIAWWGRAAERKPPAVVLQAQAVTATATQMPAEPPVPDAPPEPPVQVRNPFDAKEIFEFPPGTSETDARQQVVELLMQRARERRQSGALNVRRHHPGSNARNSTASASQ